MGCNQTKIPKSPAATGKPKEIVEPAEKSASSAPNETAETIPGPLPIKRGKSWVNPELGFKENLAIFHEMSELDKRFEMGEVLGEGITGQVRLCKSRAENTVWAMKSLNVARMDEAQIDELRREIETLRKLDHPNIISVMEVFQSTDNICIILEHCSGGDLSQRRFATENDVASIVYQLAEAVAHCHHMGIVHRDLKMENIMFASKDCDSLRLIDFGLSKKFLSREEIMKNDKISSLNDKTRIMKTACGTAFYMAPEMLTMSYSEKADVWAIGVITYMLFTGRPPFEGRDETTVFEKVRRGRVTYNESHWKRLSPEALQFTQALLRFDPEKRPSAHDLLDMPWLKKFQQNKIKTMHGQGSSMAKAVCDSLIRFGSYPPLKRAALMIISHHLNEQDTRELRDMFLTLDEDHSGELSFEEIQNMIKNFGHMHLSDEELRRIFDEIDQEHTGFIHHTEFLAATLESRVKISGKLLNAAFDHLDMDGIGMISVDNLKAIMGKNVTREGAEVIMKRGFENCVHDHNHEGVTRPEFLEMMGDNELPSPSGTPAPSHDGRENNSEDSNTNGGFDSNGATPTGTPDHLEPETGVTIEAVAAEGGMRSSIRMPPPSDLKTVEEETDSVIDSRPPSRFVE